MTREEQIAAASYSYGMRGSSIDFVAGAKWADANPKSPWISVDDDLPYNHEELIDFVFTNNVLVIDGKQNTFIAFMKKYKDNEWIWDSTNDFVFLPLITHWMPIPKLLKE